MTRIEALYEMTVNKKKVSNELFGDDEFLYVDDSNVMRDENDYNFEIGWRERCIPLFNDGWFIYKEKDYGLCPKPTKAQDALDTLCRELLGDDWYVVMSVSPEQANTYIVDAILDKYSKRKRRKIRDFFRLSGLKKC